MKLEEKAAERAQTDEIGVRKLGSQEPRICIEPHRTGTDGEDAALLMSAYGVTLDPWQQTVLNCWLGTGEDGQYTTISAGLAVPRQNGKNVCFEAREFFGLVVKHERILHTAHQTITSKKSFRRLEAMFTDKRHPEICELVKEIRYTNGEEAIELMNGGRIEFSTRSRQRARGFDGISLIVYDEAQELTDDQVEAVMATLAASTTGTRQILYAGTPPYPGCPGVVFRRRRKGCFDAPASGDAWHEWSIEGDSIDKIDVTNKELWYSTNPALGRRLTESFTAEEMRGMSKDGFARERLGWWSPVLTNTVARALNSDAWDACVSHELKPEGKTAYGVKFAGEEVALCGAVIPANGAARVSLIERRSMSAGTQWLADWLNARYDRASCVVIDGRNGVDVLVDKLSETWKAKDSVVIAGTKTALAAVSGIVDAVNEKRVSWYYTQEALRESAVTSIRRPIGGGWGFGGENSAPIEAAALALWGAKSSKRDPNRKMMIG